MVKVYPMITTNDGEVRVMIINKMHWANATVTVSVNRGSFGTASVSRLTARDGLTSRGFIMLGGWYFRCAGIKSARSEGDGRRSATWRACKTPLLLQGPPLPFR